jgi:hypothetical protein
VSCDCNQGQDLRGGPCNMCTWDAGNRFAHGCLVKIHPVIVVMHELQSDVGRAYLQRDTDTYHVRLENETWQFDISPEFLQALEKF